jgi:hypothetical protein
MQRFPRDNTRATPILMISGMKTAKPHVQKSFSKFQKHPVAYLDVARFLAPSPCFHEAFALVEISVNATSSDSLFPQVRTFSP